MKWFDRMRKGDRPPGLDRPAVGLSSPTAIASRRDLKAGRQITAMLTLASNDVDSGRYRTLLYRFLAESIPVVSACIWTWGRLAAAPGRFEIVEDGADAATAKEGRRRLDRLARDLYTNINGQRLGMTSFLVDAFTGLFRDGFFGGFATVKTDGSGIDTFVPVDAAKVGLEADGTKQPYLYLDRGESKLRLQRPDFYYLTLEEGVSTPLGRSVLQSVPFVTYVEQQLVDDMRRASHNSGFHRLHVRVTPPERMAGEADEAYTDRINGYFDATLSMIRSCEVDHNPVTWDNVAIDTIGPGRTYGLTNQWFYHHRAMVEEICAGTKLAPFLLGYSFGDTTSWSTFKFDMVMRQVQTVQAEMARFLEWLGDIDLALGGCRARCRWVFDNDLPHRAGDRTAVAGQRIDNIIKLVEAGLVDHDDARRAVEGLL